MGEERRDLHQAKQKGEKPDSGWACLRPGHPPSAAWRTLTGLFFTPSFAPLTLSVPDLIDLMVLIILSSQSCENVIQADLFLFLNILEKKLIKKIKEKLMSLYRLGGNGCIIMIS